MTDARRSRRYTIICLICLDLIRFMAVNDSSFFTTQGHLYSSLVLSLCSSHPHLDTIMIPRLILSPPRVSFLMTKLSNPLFIQSSGMESWTLARCFSPLSPFR